MFSSQSLLSRLCPLLCLILLSVSAVVRVEAQFGAPLQGGGFVVFGRVSLPSGKPAARVKVYLEMSNGLHRDTITNDDGNYEFRAVTAGRYRVRAVNPEAPEQYSDPAESDSTRAYSNRVQINVYLRLPLHDEKKNYKAGMVSVAEATQNIPGAARKAYEQGLKLQKENRAEQALAEFTRAIELYPDYFQALTERANLLMATNRLAEAEADFERALELNGQYTPALRSLGHCELQQKKFTEALGHLAQAYAREPNVPLTLLLLGYANLSLDRYAEAKECLQQALKLAPESAARAHVYLAEVFAHEGRFKEAADAVRKYLSVKPSAADAARLKEIEAEWRMRAKAAGNQP